MRTLSKAKVKAMKARGVKVEGEQEKPDAPAAAPPPPAPDMSDALTRQAAYNNLSVETQRQTIQALAARIESGESMLADHLRSVTEHLTSSRDREPVPYKMEVVSRGQNGKIKEIRFEPIFEGSEHGGV